eukprot:6182816-Pleurochrysis_carterae.AAC.2
MEGKRAVTGKERANASESNQQRSADTIAIQTKFLAWHGAQRGSQLRDCCMRQASLRSSKRCCCAGDDTSGRASGESAVRSQQNACARAIAETNSEAQEWSSMQALTSGRRVQAPCTSAVIAHVRVSLCGNASVPVWHMPPRASTRRPPNSSNSPPFAYF